MPTLIDTDEAYRKCQALADSHYENFPVAKMLPAKLRKHVAAIYAFARTADDIADEEHETIAADSPLRVEKLRRFESQLLVGSPAELDPQWAWIFVALAETIKKFDIPVQLLRDLVDAFAQDVVKKRYDDFLQLLDYCRQHIAKYAMPKEIEFRDDLPKTLVGKVAYRVLEEEEAAKAAAAAAEADEKETVEAK